MTETSIFGTLPDGTQVEELSLRHGKLACQIITYGGAVRALTVPDRAGRPVDVVLGFDRLEDYLAHDKYLGALIGRYGNRIGGARFPLNGVEYPLTANDGPNHLHGGPKGFDKRVWTVERRSADAVTLSLTSPAMEEGYPGALRAEVTYRLTDDALELDYLASADADTPCNLTNHSYFNLAGHDAGEIGAQFIRLPARFYTPTDPGSIPTGEIAPVAGTPMDLRAGAAMGAGWDGDFPQLRQAGGFDHNWVVPGPVGALRPAGEAWSDQTGIRLRVFTTQAGIQFYSGNYLDGCPAGKGGAPYARRHGFCLETQSFPDTPNIGHFPSALLRKGQCYHHTTVYRFDTF